MTLLFGKASHEGGPKLHALIIGVGHYPHLNLSEAPRRKLPALAPLRSPPLSANALATWLIANRSTLSVPLGSVELLVSEIPEASGAVRRPRRAATLQNIAKAYDEWFSRCDADPDNVAFFHFCGHGLQKEVTLLLPEDFGSMRNSPWATAIDFNAMYRSMANCSATTQYYVIDACRQWTQSMLQDLNVSGMALGTADLKQQKARTAPQLFAAASGLPAFGDSGGPSRLTKALIACLEGGAAEKVDGRWHVPVDRIGKAVKVLVELRNRILPPEQQQRVDPVIGEFSAGPRDLITLPIDAHPQVVVEFACKPEEATARGAFYYEGVHPQIPRREAGRPGPWTQEMLAGIYQLGVCFGAPKAYQDAALKFEIINPPVRPVNLSVSPAPPPKETVPHGNRNDHP